MKSSRCNTLMAALLVCLAPAAASATEAYLTPSKNGGSGAMPSGYSTLHFDLANGDWIRDLRLPAEPRNGDVVVLSSEAEFTAHLATGRTSLENLGYLPVPSGSNVMLRWNSSMGNWHVLGGDSARLLTLHASGEATVPASAHAVTDVYTSASTQITKVNLPQWANDGAQLVFHNRTDTALRSGSQYTYCFAGESCAYVFSSQDGHWHARIGKVQVKPTESQLPVPVARMTRVVAGSAAEDITMPAELRLPATAVQGDLYTLSNPSKDHFAVLSPVNTDQTRFMSLASTPRTFRYDGAQQRWMLQPN